MGASARFKCSDDAGFTIWFFGVSIFIPYIKLNETSNILNIKNVEYKDSGYYFCIRPYLESKINLKCGKYFIARAKLKVYGKWLYTAEFLDCYSRYLIVKANLIKKRMHFIFY